MTKINRFSGNLQPFAVNAGAGNRFAFFTATAADALNANINADFLTGWELVGANSNPTKQDFNALGYTATALSTYLHQVGVAEWDALQEYFTGSIANVGGTLYSATADNTGTNPVGDLTGTWVEVGNSTIPNGSITLPQLADGTPDHVIGFAPVTGAPVEIPLTDFDNIVGGSNTTNGYVQFDNGLILQWGRETGVAGQNFVDVVLPIAFPNRIINAQTSDMAAAVNQIEGVVPRSIPDFDVESTILRVTKQGVVGQFVWFAIGN